MKAQLIIACAAFTLLPQMAQGAKLNVPPGQTVVPPGQLRQVDKPLPPGQVKQGDKPVPPVQPGGKNGSPPGQEKKDASKSPSGHEDHDREGNDARRAVELGDALPLARIIRQAQSRSDGRVIDAKLLNVGGALVYRLTLVDDSGRSWREFYLARTGNPVAF